MPYSYIFKNNEELYQAIYFYYHLSLDCGPSKKDWELMKQDFINVYGNPSEWNTSNITYITSLFCINGNDVLFDFDISKWNVSNVKNNNYTDDHDDGCGRNSPDSQS
jgi:hypothetical protein